MSTWWQRPKRSVKKRLEMESLSREDAAALLLACGIQPTSQRVGILFVLLTCGKHPCAEEILSMVNKRFKKTAMATVYNTLKLFAANGIIREVVVDKERVFYDADPTPHPHFYDAATGRLFDIHEEIEVKGIPQPPEGLDVDRIEVVVRLRTPTSEINHKTKEKMPFAKKR